MTPTSYGKNACVTREADKRDRGKCDGIHYNCRVAQQSGSTLREGGCILGGVRGNARLQAVRTAAATAAAEEASPSMTLSYGGNGHEPL